MYIHGLMEKNPINSDIFQNVPKEKWWSVGLLYSLVLCSKKKVFSFFLCVLSVMHSSFEYKKLIANNIPLIRKRCLSIEFIKFIILKMFPNTCCSLWIFLLHFFYLKNYLSGNCILFDKQLSTFFFWTLQIFNTFIRSITQSNKINPKVGFSGGSNNKILFRFFRRL